MNQLLIFLFAFFLGILSLNFFSPGINYKWILSSGFIWGCLFIFIISLLTDVIKVSFMARTFLIGFLLLILIFLNLKSKQAFSVLISKKNITHTIIYISIFVILVLYFDKKEYVMLTNDSFRIIYHGFLLSKNLGINTVSREWFYRSFGIIESYIQSFASLDNKYFFTSLHPVLGFSFISTMLVSIESIIDSKKKDLKITAIIILMALLLSTTFLMFIQYFYVHLSLFTSIFITLALICLILFQKTRSKSWTILFNFSLIGFFFSRPEAFIYIIIILYLTWKKFNFTKHEQLYLFLPIIITVLVWSLYSLIKFYNSYYLIVSNNILILSMVIYLLFSMIILFQQNKIIRRIKNSRISSGSLIIFSITILFLLMNNHIYTSFIVIMKHLFFSFDEWGFSWIICLLIIILMNFIKVPKPIIDYKFFSNLILCYFLMVIDLTMFRSSYRLSWEDSGNRMISHIFPFAVLVCTIYLVDLYSSIKKKHKQILPD